MRTKGANDYEVGSNRKPLDENNDFTLGVESRTAVL
jgi:hypothetical protein